MKNKRVVVTGGHGFLGSYVMKELSDSGFTDVTTFHSNKYDLTSKDQMFSMFVELKPEIIIHLAADCGGIGYNRESPALLFYNNAIMGINLIHMAMQSQQIEKFVQIGTVCSYPKFPYTVPFEEESLWFGYPEKTNAPYGLAKKMLLVQAQAYRDQFGLNSIYLIPTNLYGPRDNFSDESSHVIPALIKKFYRGKQTKEESITIWGDGSPTREFLYVEDAAKAIVMATERYDRGEPCNVGTGKEISIKQLAILIKEMIGFGGDIIFDTTKPNGQPRRVLDTQKAYKEFGFKAMTELEDGLRKTIDWYREYQWLR